MIADLKPYPEYKDSRLPWIGRVPEHWDVLPNRALFSEINDRGHESEELLSVTITKGIIRQKALLTDSIKKDSSRQDKSAYKLVQPDDIAYNKMRAWQGALGVSDLRGIISPAYIVMRLRKGNNVPRFFHYLYRTPNFSKEAERWSYGITSDMWSLRPEHFKMIYTPEPPPSEQEAIVRFLDHANAKIDSYVRAKKKLIRLLNEQKQAIIHRAVTRGLNPNVPLKDSGVEWLGQIPAHWETRRIKQVTQILRGKFTHRPRNDPSLYDGPYPFIQTGSVARAEKFITEYKQTLNERGLAVSKMFPKGTLCMTIAANIGDVAVLDFEACFPDSIVGFVPKHIVVRDYLFYVFRCMKLEFLLDAPVNTQGNLNVERIGVKGMPLPEAEEQELIVKYIESETVAYEDAITRTKREIELLNEYRTKLTADVVTGKLDVREAAKGLPEELVVESDGADSTDETDLSDDADEVLQEEES